MARVITSWFITLRQGVAYEEFERFMREDFTALWTERFVGRGMKPRLLKGDRGDGIGKYLFVNEFDSVETRDRFFPAMGTQNAEVGAAFQTETYRKLMSMINTPVIGDYVEIHALE